MSTNEDAIALLVRRRAVFERLCTARDATQKGTTERVRLDCICEKSAVRLMNTARSVSETNARRHEILTALSPIPVRGKRASFVCKWKGRITHELAILETALSHLQNAKSFLTVACGDVFAGVPILRTRLDLAIFNGNGKRSRNDTPAIQESHAEIAAAYIQAARDVCTYVRREISASLPLRLRRRNGKRALPEFIDTNNNNQSKSTSTAGVPRKALDTISKVHRDVRKYEIQAKEQLAILATADTEMDCILLSARENAINDALSMPVSGTTSISMAISMPTSNPISVDHDDQQTQRQSNGNDNHNSNINIPIDCDGIAKLDMKRALELLIALT